jgi:hypothetical protein
VSESGTQIRERIELLLRAVHDKGAAQEDLTDALTAGYGYALSLDSERLRLERRITELAAKAEEPDAAAELRRLWLRHRTLESELRELRGKLRMLREEQASRG